MLKRKADVFDIFKQFRALVENSTSRFIKCLRSSLNVLEQIMEPNLLLSSLIIIAKRMGSRGIRPLFTLRSRTVLLNA